MKTIALIPARAGSKGIVGKNIVNILGKPLIEYSIEVALESKCIDEVWVSSDSEDILKVASQYQEINIHRRSSSLATDTSSINETIFEILNLTKQCDLFVLLQPTSPIRDSSNIDEAVNLLKNNNLANSLISVCGMDDVHPARMYWMKNFELQPIMQEYESTRRQDIPTAYYRNGSIYIVRKEAFMRTNSIIAKPSIGYVMPTSYLLNIDEPRDLIIAEPLIKKWLESRSN
jgi:CMP-N,N'-diacetyllegionaminic acid synthase